MADQKAQSAAERGMALIVESEAAAVRAEAQAVAAEARREEAEAYTLIAETAAWSGQLLVPPTPPLPPLPPHPAPGGETVTVVQATKLQIDAINETLKGISRDLDRVAQAAGTAPAEDERGSDADAGAKPRK